MPVAQRIVEKLVASFRKDLTRAEALYERIALSGARKNSDDSYSPLMQPDRRDAAQFIFFEVAAKFEAFCSEAFMIEVRHEFSVQPQRAMFIMGSIDRGLIGVMGWGAPKQLQDRACRLYGMRGFFARLKTKIGDDAYQRLVNAHKIRNRIAHSGGNASKDFNAILGQLQVPATSRKGLSVGRLLMDYPSNASQEDRWFYRLLAAYRTFADEFGNHFGS